MKSASMLEQGFVPEAIISVLKKIEHSGFQVFIVGGAVRDLYLGRVPIEYDLATNARPEEIIQLFDRTTAVGIEYGTVTVHFEGLAIEVTTFRTESNYKDHRHPNDISFVGNIEDDLKRRDFTMNAMAYQPLNETLIDPFSGQKDIDQRQIRTVGDPQHRFEEDALRPFRAFRFLAQLGFTFNSDLLMSLQSLTHLTLPSTERIKHEMTRLLMARFWMAGVTIMANTGWLKQWYIDVDSDGIPDLPHDQLFRWAWLLSLGDFDKLSAYFQFSKQDIRHMNLIIKWGFDQEAISFCSNDLAIDSYALQSMGLIGKALGDMQRTLVDLVRLKKIENNRDDLKEYVLNHLEIGD